MPRYFFHVRDGRDIPDEEGTLLADDKEARDQAITTTGMMLQAEGRKFWSGATEWSMTVLDEAGKKICVLRFTIE